MDQPISLDKVIGFLDATPLFSDLDAAERGEVVRIMEVQRLQKGEQIFREGDAGDAWYVIFEGKARVLKDSGGAPTAIATLGPGDAFGEMAILDGLARSASVEAAGPLTMFRFRRERFQELLDQGSLGAFKLVAGMARTLSRRQRQLTEHLSELMESSKGGRGAIGDAVERMQLSE
jgi:CRP-like cAMP-binding protein